VNFKEMSWKAWFQILVLLLVINGGTQAIEGLVQEGEVENHAENTVSSLVGALAMRFIMKKDS
jgi:hypothetical protein